MKKSRILLALVLALVLCAFLLTACDTDGDTEDAGTTTTTTTANPPAPKYTVTFMIGDEVLATAETDGKNLETHKYGKEGLAVFGWYYNKELTNPFDHSKDISSDLTLYAKSEAVTVNGNYATLSNGLKFYSISDNTAYKVDDCPTSATEIIIPESVNGKPVTSIGEDAFYGCSALESITIPNSVTSIGDCAFYGCSGLTSITIPNSVTSIGEYAFYDCSSLSSITIPNSVTSIGEYAFYDCSSLSSITIPSSVTSIGAGAFSFCTGLTSITIPSSVTSIGRGAFEYCTELTSVTIPNSVTSIGNLAFCGCSSLSSITFEDTNGWYYTTNYQNWENKRGGTAYDATNVSANASMFKNNYNYYWYKISE